MRSGLCFICEGKGTKGKGKRGKKKRAKQKRAKHAEIVRKSDQLNRAKGSRGDFVPFLLPLAGSRDSVPCGVWGNAPILHHENKQGKVRKHGSCAEERSVFSATNSLRQERKLLFSERKGFAPAGATKGR